MRGFLFRCSQPLFDDETEKRSGEDEERTSVLAVPTGFEPVF